MDAHSSSTSMVVSVLEDTLDSHPIDPSAASHADSLLVLANSSTRPALPLLTLELYEAQQLLLASSETKYDLQVQIAEELELEFSRKAEEVRVLRRQLEDAWAEKERVSTDAQRLRKEVERLKAQDATKEVRSQLRSDHRKVLFADVVTVGSPGSHRPLGPLSRRGSRKTGRRGDRTRVQAAGTRAGALHSSPLTSDLVIDVPSMTVCLLSSQVKRKLGVKGTGGSTPAPPFTRQSSTQHRSQTPATPSVHSPSPLASRNVGHRP